MNIPLQRIRKLVSSLRHQGLRSTAAHVCAKAHRHLNATPLISEAVREIPMSRDPNYQHWLFQNHPRKADLALMRQTISLFAVTPTVSIIVPTYNTPETFLHEMIQSVLSQVYPHWELCLADDASTAPHVQPILEEYASKDSRIKIVLRPENGHISAASNSALALATGEWVALLDHDDLLLHNALYEVVLCLNQNPSIDLIYSDEDKLDSYWCCYDAFFKPDWSPDSLLSRMYTSHLSVYRRKLMQAIGGFREGFEGSQDYDLALRFTEKTNKIFHIPKVLYHWRAHEQSTAHHLETKNYAVDAAKKAIEEALIRRNEPGIVLPNGHGHFIVRYHISNPQKVSIIIPTRDMSDLLSTCLESVFNKTSYSDYEVIVLDNGSVESTTLRLFEKWTHQEPLRFRVVRWDVPFNFARINNHTVQHATGSILLFLNNDTQILTDDWLTAMVEQAQRPSIGAVGALLLYPDNTVQHAGVIAGIGGIAGHSHKMLPSHIPGYFDQLKTVNNYSAVTGACLMCRRDVFNEVGGFEEILSHSFNDVDLCFKFLQHGYRNVFLPHVVIYHFESKSRGYEDTPAKQQRFLQEIKYMKNKWNDLIEHDPSYNPNLSRITENYQIRLAYDAEASF